MEEHLITTGTTGHAPVTACDDTYDQAANTRPAWVDQLPDPDLEVARWLAAGLTADRRPA